MALLAAAGCAAAPEARPYELQGQILAIRPEPQELLIEHGDIVGFMPGMTMPFKVRDERLLSSKAPGDLIRARLMVGRDEAWLATLEKTGTAPLEEAAAFPAASFVTPLKAGDPVPDATLTDQGGTPLTISAWRDSAVVVTFSYIRCPLPQFCPLMDRRFAEVQRAVREDPVLNGRVHLLSVSFDPRNDTPEAMTAHAARAGAEPSVWRFATAAPEVVDRFAAAFGVNVIREPDGTITHNLRTAVIAPGGRVVSVHDDGDWTAAQVVAELRAAFSPR
jgi:protein SCO1